MELNTLLTVVTLPGDGSATSRLTLGFPAEPERLNEFLACVKDLCDEYRVSSSPGAKGRYVEVVEVDREEHAKWLRSSGVLPRNGLYAEPTEQGMWFQSARAASVHLGLKHNEVAMALARMEDVPHRKSRKIVLRGVTLAYMENLAD